LYEYLFAKYGYGSGVSYVGNLSGIIRFLGQVAGCGLTEWTFFGPGSVGVPYGGTTVLLGMALVALSMYRRFAMS
jgi:hypothetical protein